MVTGIVKDGKDVFAILDGHRVWIDSLDVVRAYDPVAGHYVPSFEWTGLTEAYIWESLKGTR